MIRKIALGLLALCASHAASAALISGDFRTESNLPDSRTGTPLVYQSLDQSIGAGYELNGGDFVSNPDGWGGGVVFMDFDPTTNILTLDSQDEWDFQTFDAWISNIAFDLGGEFISGFTLLTNELTTPGFLPTLTFTPDSLHVSYDYTPGSFNFTSRTATFQIETSSLSVPAPAPLALMGLALLGLGFSRRRAKV